MNSTIENRKSEISRLPLKLAIMVVVIFGLLVTSMVLWKPMKVRYYAGKYARAETPAERIKLVDILCDLGKPGKEALYSVFRKRCISEQVKIPAGSFMMFVEKNKVMLSSFWMDKYEVTNEKYYVFIKSTGRKFPERWESGKIPEELEQNPVVWVPRYNAKAYAEWLDVKLPNAQEWQYAASAGSTGVFCFGDNNSLLEEYAWYERNSGGRKHPVGQKKANKWGLHDVHGNACEWCQEDLLVIVGGSFGSQSWECKTHMIFITASVEGAGGIGFRCVRDVK